MTADLWNLVQNNWPAVGIGLSMLLGLGYVWREKLPSLRPTSGKKTPYEQIVELMDEQFCKVATLPPQVREAEFQKLDQMRHLAQQSMIGDDDK